MHKYVLEQTPTETTITDGVVSTYQTIQAMKIVETNKPCSDFALSIESYRVEIGYLPEETVRLI